MVTDWPGVETPTLHSLISLHWPFLNSYPSGHESHLKLPSVLTQTSEAFLWIMLDLSINGPIGDGYQGPDDP